jgi:tRNA dimethylallyltransferase
MGKSRNLTVEQWRAMAVEQGDLLEIPPAHKSRFRTLIFWVYEPLETLRPRLDRRVGKMVEVSFFSIEAPYR